MTPQLYNDCKAAFLADWTTTGRFDTFAAWIANAFERHARRTPTERARVEAAPSGSPRSFVVPTSVHDQMRAALVGDQRAGHWLTVSAWCNAALIEAVEAARNELGAPLPSPPARLPQRLAELRL